MAATVVMVARALLATAVTAATVVWPRTKELLAWPTAVMAATVVMVARALLATAVTAATVVWPRTKELLAWPTAVMAAASPTLEQLLD
jgi:hypothetical protein